MLRKIKERLNMVEAVLDALISLLDKREVVRRDEIQLEILARAAEGDDSDEDETVQHTEGE